ncbi:MAG TPA: hypothetical protein VMT52_13280 [Planctomycetota bacterium]|nr:hypothetical protein [Planctomycetota bacterium]
MRRIQNVGAALGLLLVLAAPARGATIRGRAIDGEESSRGIVEALRAGHRFDPALKLPFAEKQITIDLISLDGGSGTPSKSWSAVTDASGAFVVETGNDIIPPGSPLVARAAAGDSQLFSAYFFPGEAPAEVHLFPTTESMASLTADLTVAYDVDRSEGTEHAIRVRVRLHVLNRGNDMYVGRKGASGSWREIWRIPLPPEAKITLSSGPFPGVPGWSLSADGAWAILDTPIPGVSDFEHQGPWDIHYLLPARQRLVQTYPVALPMEPQRVSFWCVPKDMALESAKLKDTSTKEEDPLTGEKRSFENIFSSATLTPGEKLSVLLTVDNVAVGQMVSRKGLFWVGGFVLVVVISILLGLSLGSRGKPLDQILEELSGEEVLDRIADLDRRHARGEIPEREYRSLRAPLVDLAAEELSVPAGAVGPSSPGLPPGAREILRRIDEIDQDKAAGPALAMERAHLLEALARALPREGRGG